MEKVFFTSDTHYGHANIIKYCLRPFSSTEEMNAAMIDRWNSVVGKSDIVYHLGDVSFLNAERTVEILNKLNGMKFLVTGNHDLENLRNQQFRSKFIGVSEMVDTVIEKQRVVMCHYAMRVWNQSHRGAWNLFGHSHNTLEVENYSLQVDVGVDGWNFTPVSFEQLKEHMDKKTYKPVDHHGNRK